MTLQQGQQHGLRQSMLGTRSRGMQTCRSQQLAARVFSCHCQLTLQKLCDLQQTIVGNDESRFCVARLLSSLLHNAPMQCTRKMHLAFQYHVS